MDTLSHGLWGAAIFGRRSRARFYLALLLGILPDLASFGPYLIIHFETTLKRLSTQGLERPSPDLFPSYVHMTYNITHSLILWTLLFALLWFFLRRPPLIWGAWGLHILCDIPTHTKAFFPTPFLWPFPTPFINGIHWTAPWFLILNYSLIITVLCLPQLRQRRKSRT